MIVSEAQAERVGEHLTGGFRGTDFRVFLYVAKPWNLTLFGVEIGKQVITRDPRAAEPRNPVNEGN